MKRIDKIKELEKRIEELEKKQPINPFYSVPMGETMFPPECLHNGCGHDRNLTCVLYCSHCGPMC